MLGELERVFQANGYPKQCDMQGVVQTQTDTVATGRTGEGLIGGGYPTGEAKDDLSPLTQMSFRAHRMCLQEGRNKSCIQDTRDCMRVPDQGEDLTAGGDEERSGVQGTLYGL